MCDRIGTLAVGKDFGPMLDDDVEEFERDLPPAGEIAVDQAAEVRPAHAFGLHFVEESGEIARQPDRIGRRGRHDDILVEKGGDMRREAPLPRLHQRREQQQPVERRNRRIEVGRRQCCG